MHAQAVRNVVGSIGNVISFLLFLSPVPTFYRIWKKKDVEDFQPYPYIATVLNCLLWIFYGLPFVTPNSILVVTINSVGLAIELLYLAVYLIYDKQNKGRKKVLGGLLGELIFMIVIVAIGMAAFHHPGGKRSLFVGVFADIFNIAMYASPLGVMRMVIKTKSVEYMPLYLSVAGFANGCIWTAYACIGGIDKFVLISNGCGTVLGFVQLALYAFYYRTTPKSRGHDKPSKQSEIQLPASFSSNV